ncbi:ATP phosphoribosyltransferase [Clostridium sp. cel8]|uniref:ATP phosphoribosyltransferase n=1 Tax=unclassified Clostridium TaxID=2614128 RepID=UPI0015F352ED|nr:ATP phosphoribosyltransferase [Clostridium sp. cel8]MBA5850580.1 ATP phosphoribosyltransferase [Clostridium sp. cel8]
MDIRKPLKIALTKGRIEKSAVQMFKAIGVDCTEIENKGRKLIFHDDKYNVDFVLVKAPDVITYVEHGAADIGIVGKDTIMEFNKNYYELMDLKFGKCKFSLAGPKGKNFYEGYRRKKIATKYPNVARNYFKKIGYDIDIIKIEGSVELAPILGLSDAIVDIVETGNTLRENGLEVYSDICNISTRLITNIASLKMKKFEIESIVDKLREEVEKREEMQKFKGALN